jgi:hypothetical protein
MSKINHHPDLYDQWRIIKNLYPYMILIQLKRNSNLFSITISILWELFIDTRYNYFLKILVFNRIFQKGIIKASS